MIKMGKKGFVKGTILCGLAGAVAALLLAPKSGKETQEDLKKAIKQTGGDLQEKLKVAGDELTVKTDALKAAAKDLVGEAKEDSKTLLARADVLRQDIKIAVGKLAESSAQTGEAATKSAHKLMDESAAVLTELEKAGKELGASARAKVEEAVKKDAK
jgi:gas vesicle protein